MTTPNSKLDDGQSPFWNFSLEFYAQPQVATACIELQDCVGVDVNVLLFLLFLARQGRQLTPSDIALIDGVVQIWRDQVVKPLRTLRRDLKNGLAPSDVEAAAALRTDVKRIELEAERIEQQMLEHSFPASTIGTQAPSPGQAARANIDAYSKVLGELPAAPANILLQAFVGN